jgi:hypothetical protein
MEHNLHQDVVFFFSDRNGLNFKLCFNMIQPFTGKSNSKLSSGQNGALLPHKEIEYELQAALDCQGQG